VLHPPGAAALAPEERELLERAARLDMISEMLHPPAEESAAAGPRGRSRSGPAGGSSARAAPEAAPAGSPRRPLASGWSAWHWGSDVTIAYWRRVAPDRLVCLELERIRLLSDLVAWLPDTDPGAPVPSEGRIALVDARDQVVHQWGVHEPVRGELARATLPLSPPLGPWRLRYYLPAGALATGAGLGLIFNLTAGLALVAVTLGAAAVHVHREWSREMREAAQRVSFVNQVSHELKTPLTNVRMYAELLEQELAPDEERPRRHLQVIVAESQRLSRLIANVLTFARRQRESAALRPADACLDDVVAAVIEQFAPSLAARGIQVEHRRGAPGIVPLDGDALGQIIGNLISNVEKYAGAGGWLSVSTRQEAGRACVTVSDRGPGIPADQREAVFLPFHRLADATAESPTGTGIGLTIARDLARLHGGDLAIVDSPRGTTFELTLATPPPGGASAAPAATGGAP
jgi:signal transduction histidine kinase